MRRIVTVVISITIILSSMPNARAGEANDYLVPGRSELFGGTVSGIRSAYQIFDDGLNDSNCPDCDTNRELKFFRALAGTGTLLVRDDGNSVDSVLELIEKFGITTFGDSWAPYLRPLGLDFVQVRNQYDIYQIPADAPNINELQTIFDTSILPEIDLIIADLNSISDSNGDRFKVFLEPLETQIFFHPDSRVFDSCSPGYDPGSRFLSQLEVDYGDVLLLKAGVIMLKSMIKTQQAYDLYTDPNNILLEKYYGDALNVNDDLLDRYPDLLKVFPTSNDSNDGSAILAKSRQDFIKAINYYLDAIAYISNEDLPQGTDSQDDELLTIDPNDNALFDSINERLTTVRDSLIDDTTGTYPRKTSRVYNLTDPCSTTWQLTLNYDIIEIPHNNPGSFIALNDNNAPGPWEIDYFSLGVNQIWIDLEYDVPGLLGGGFLELTISEDGNNITNADFHYWGFLNGDLYGLTGQKVSTQIQEVQADFNPMFGSSPRYAQPVNPRDLLPELDQYNQPLPGTIASGLGFDPTLGGIAPDMTLLDWQLWFDLQPSGLLYLQEIYPWQKNEFGFVDIWLQSQSIFQDIASDTRHH